MYPLTDRQAEVLDAIDDLTYEAGYPPTMRELGDRLGINTAAGVEHHLIALRNKGYVTWRRRRPRSLVTRARHSAPIIGIVGHDGRISWGRGRPEGATPRLTPRPESRHLDGNEHHGEATGAVSRNADRSDRRQ